jgi:hypothetical protein
MPNYVTTVMLESRIKVKIRKQGKLLLLLLLILIYHEYQMVIALKHFLELYALNAGNIILQYYVCSSYSAMSSCNYTLRELPVAAMCITHGLVLFTL